MEIIEVKRILEALLFVSDRALSLKEIINVVKDDYSDTKNIENLLNELKAEYESSDKPYEIKFVAGGWTFATKSDYSVWIRKLLNEKKAVKLSPSALEVLAIVAYKQPITRADIDEIRGVDSSWALDTLVERKLARITGRKEALGRPLLYGTTQEFLKHFGLAHLGDLPLIDGEILKKADEKIAEATIAELPLYEQIENSEDESLTDTVSETDASAQDELIDKTDNVSSDDISTQDELADKTEDNVSSDDISTQDELTDKTEDNISADEISVQNESNEQNVQEENISLSDEIQEEDLINNEIPASPNSDISMQDGDDKQDTDENNKAEE
jgi:segregation and condensation protein B